MLLITSVQLFGHHVPFIVSVKATVDENQFDFFFLNDNFYTPLLHWVG